MSKILNVSSHEQGTGDDKVSKHPKTQKYQNITETSSQLEPAPQGMVGAAGTLPMTTEDTPNPSLRNLT